MDVDSGSDGSFTPTLCRPTTPPPIPHKRSHSSHRPPSPCRLSHSRSREAPSARTCYYSCDCSMEAPSHQGHHVPSPVCYQSCMPESSSWIVGNDYCSRSCSHSYRPSRTSCSLSRNYDSRPHTRQRFHLPSRGRSPGPSHQCRASSSLSPSSARMCSQSPVFRSPAHSHRSYSHSSSRGRMAETLIPPPTTEEPPVPVDDMVLVPTQLTEPSDLERMRNMFLEPPSP